MSARARRPISRRLMLAMFALMLAPMAGWFFVTAPIDPEAQATEAEAQARLRQRDEVRAKLGATFVFAVLVAAGGVVYVRRSMIDPLADLAARARTVGEGRWQPPADLDRPDEIGDLGRALHDSVSTLEARAEEAVRFAVSLSHELRTPLAAIKGAAEILADGTIEAEDRARFVRNIASESERLERLVAGLLDLERARQGTAPKPDGACDLGATVRSAVERAAPLWKRKALTVDVETQDGLPRISTDPDRATRVLLGLLENAVKFSPRAAQIRIQVRSAGDGAELVVEDAGPGVPDAVKPRVFDRAFVGDRGAGARGTGLGLAIVQSLVQSAGGRVVVEDGAQGGARFTASWPTAPSA